MIKSKINLVKKHKKTNHLPGGMVYTPGTMILRSFGIHGCHFQDKLRLSWPSSYELIDHHPKFDHIYLEYPPVWYSVQVL